MKNLIIYRTCDRPKYVKETLPKNVERTSFNDTLFLVADNSTDKEEGRQTAESFLGDNVDFFQTEGVRVGGTNLILEVLRVYERRTPDLKHVFVVDDDVIVPEQLDNGDTWNEILIEMLEAGWDVAGHPWTNGFRQDNPKEIGGVKGYLHSGIAGGCSSFRLDYHRKNSMSQITRIRGYNEWMVRYNRNRTGYSDRGRMTFQHIDRPDHPLSLRDTEYNDWADEMYYERFPAAREQGKKRPKGMKGIW